jgi:hypothetical protein
LWEFIHTCLIIDVDRSFKTLGHVKYEKYEKTITRYVHYPFYYRRAIVGKTVPLAIEFGQP